MATKTPENTSGPEQASPSEEQVERINSTIRRAEEYAATQAKTADILIRQHPYETLGIALGLGILVGLLVARR